MGNMTRKDFVQLCMEADYPVRRIGDIPIETRKACIELAKQSAMRKRKHLHEILPFVMKIRGQSGKVELAVLIEKENEIT